MWRSETIGYAWSLWGSVVVCGALAIPVAIAIAAWLAARRRRAGSTPGWAARSAYAEVLMIVGTAPWVWVTLTPNHAQARGRNMVPFRDLIHQVHVGPLYAAMQIGGNLLVFAALGFGMPIRWRVGPLAALLVGAAGSMLIEVLQWQLDLGRYSSVDDVVVNATGAVLAAWCSRRWWLRRAPIQAAHEPAASITVTSG